jgi:hypothetical protein
VDEKTCIVCGITFEAKRRDARLCSSRCRQKQSKINRGLNIRESLPDGCKRCGKCKQVKPVAEFFWLDGKRKRYQSYCKPCTRASQRASRRQKQGLPADATLKIGGPAAPEGHIYTHRGYRLIKRGGHHRADQYGYVFEHIVVAEEKYGIPITREYTVHHRNRDRADNRPENLELRVGNHGKGGDLMHTLLSDPSMRAVAVAVLREHGYVINEPGDRRNR